MSGIKEKKDARVVTLILRDRDGLNEKIHIINIRTALPADKIIPAIKAASQEYLNTPEGREVWEHNCHNFNYGDFGLYVSDEICVRHGFWCGQNDDVEIMEDDFNVTLAEPEENE